MSAFIPQVLIFGHSFVRHLHNDLTRGFYLRAKQNVNLAGSGVCVSLKKLENMTSSCKPDIIILELGTNDL